MEEWVKSTEFSKGVLGVNLKLARKKAGLTLEEVAEKVDTTRSTLSSYEKGNRNMPVHLLVRLLELYNVSFKDVTGGIG